MWKTKTEAFETRGNVILITWTCANDSYGAFPKRQRLECFTVDGKNNCDETKVNVTNIKLAHPLKCVSEGGG